MLGEGIERCTLPRVLSILLVTSSSRGQNLVFRYPPEPGHDQWPPLSQRHKSNKAAHGATPSAGGDRNITAKSSIGNVNAGTATSAGASGRKRGKRSAGGRNITTNDAEGNIHNASDAPVSAFLMPRPMSGENISRGQHNGNGSNTLSGSHASTSDTGGGSGSSGHHHHSGGGNGGGASFGPLFGYSSEFLASMLSPEAILCDQPFIVKIDDLVFQGYPSLLPQSRSHGLAAAGSPTGAGDTELNHSINQIQMFHVCFVTTVGRSTVTRQHDDTSATGTSMYTSDNHKIYIDLVKQLTAGLVHEELRCGFLSSQVEKMLDIHHAILEESKAHDSSATYGDMGDDRERDHNRDSPILSVKGSGASGRALALANDPAHNTPTLGHVQGQSPGQPSTPVLATGTTLNNTGAGMGLSMHGGDVSSGVGNLSLANMSRLQTSSSHQSSPDNHSQTEPPETATPDTHQGTSGTDANATESTGPADTERGGLEREESLEGLTFRSSGNGTGAVHTQAQASPHTHGEGDSTTKNALVTPATGAVSQGRVDRAEECDRDVQDSSHTKLTADTKDQAKATSPWELENRGMHTPPTSPVAAHYSTEHRETPLQESTAMTLERTDSLTDRLIQGSTLAGDLRYVYDCLTGNTPTFTTGVSTTHLHALSYDNTSTERDTHAHTSLGRARGRRGAVETTAEAARMQGQCAKLHGTAVHFSLNNWVAISWTLQEYLNKQPVLRRTYTESTTGFTCRGHIGGAGVWDGSVTTTTRTHNGPQNDQKCTYNEPQNDQTRTHSQPQNDQALDLSLRTFKSNDRNLDPYQHCESKLGRALDYASPHPVTCSYEAVVSHDAMRRRNDTSHTPTHIQRTFRPYHSLLFYSSSRSKFIATLPRDCSPALLDLMKVISPLKNFSDLARDLDAPLAHMYRLAAHLIFWRKAKLTHKIAMNSIYINNPECHLPRCVCVHESATPATPDTSEAEDTCDSPNSTQGIQIAAPQAQGCSSHGENPGLGCDFANAFPGNQLVQQMAFFNTPQSLGDYLTTECSVASPDFPGKDSESVSGWVNSRDMRYATAPARSYDAQGHVSTPQPRVPVPADQRTRVNIVVWLLRRDLLREVHSYVYLVVPPPALAARVRVAGVGVASGSESEINTDTDTDDILADRESPDLRSIDMACDLHPDLKEILYRNTTEAERVGIYAVPAAAETAKLAAFARLCPYFRGTNHFDDILWYENINRGIMDRVLEDFSAVLSVCQLPA